MSYRKYLKERNELDLYDDDANEKGQPLNVSVNANVDHYDKKGKHLRFYKYFAQGAPTLILGILGLLVGLYMLEKIQEDFDSIRRSSGVDFCENSYCDENENKTCPCAFSLVKDKLKNCGYYCGIITCPDFMTVSESLRGLEICPSLCKCKRGRSSAVGIVLTSAIFQILLVATYFAVWFIDCFDKGMILCLFLFAHLVFLFLSLMALVTSWNYNLGQVPQNKGMDMVNHDGNPIGSLFMSWTWMNTIFSGSCFGVVMYYICLSIFPLVPKSVENRIL